MTHELALPLLEPRLLFCTQDILPHRRPARPAAGAGRLAPPLLLARRGERDPPPAIPPHHAQSLAPHPLLLCRPQFCVVGQTHRDLFSHPGDLDYDEECSQREIIKRTKVFLAFMRALR